MADINPHDLAAIIAAGVRLGDPKSLYAGRSYAVVGQTDNVVDLEYLLNAPTRIKANVTIHDPDTFNAYFNKFKDPGSVIFADLSNFTIVGIFDYHAPHDAQWCSHRCTYTAPRTPEWVTWTESNARRMSQPDFAQFIENNVSDIKAPVGAAVLEVSRNLQAKRAVEFSSAIRLANGEQEFTYAETNLGTSGKIKVPEEFTLAISIFRNVDAYQVAARLRYRIDNGKLSLWYDMLHHEVAEQDAFKLVVKDIGEKTAVSVWQGSAQV